MFFYQRRRMVRLIIIFIIFFAPVLLIDPHIQAQFKVIKGYLQDYFLIRLIDDSIDIIGNGGYQAIFCFFLFVIGLYLCKKNLAYAGKYGFFGVLTSGILVQILKHIIGRARPRFNDAYLFWGPSIKNGLNGFDSFPSGHTIGAFTLATIFSEAYPRAGVIFYGVAAFIGFWRLYDNSHFISDVFTGMVLGLIIGKWFINNYPMGKVKEDFKNGTQHNA